MKIKSNTMTWAAKLRATVLEKGGIALVVMVAWMATTCHATLFSETFEPLNSGVTIGGQNGWIVDTGPGTNALVLNNAAVAFEGEQYLSMRGIPGQTQLKRPFTGAAIDEVNSNFLFSFALRYETGVDFGFKARFRTKDPSDDDMIGGFFDQNGNIKYFTNNGAATIDSGADMLPDVWYQVSFRVLPSSQTYQFNVTSNGVCLFCGIVPFNQPATNLGINDIRLEVEGGDGAHWLVDNVSITPEPSTGLLLLLGFAGIGANLFRRRKN